MLFFSILLYFYRLIDSMICSSGNGSLRLSFKYSLSLYAIDLIIPLVIQFDFLGLCLLNLIVFEGKCLFIALVMVCSRTS